MRTPGQRRGWLALALFVASIGIVVGATNPAQAELESDATISWGVTGLPGYVNNTNFTPPVLAMERIGNVLYVGGHFTDVTDGDDEFGQPWLAAFNATTGVWIQRFDPELDGVVRALQASPDGSRLFVGGQFETVNGTATGGLVALNPTNGNLDQSWSGRINGTNTVYGFDLFDGDLYVGGGFSGVISDAGRMPAYRLARFDVDSGLHDDSWVPRVDNQKVRAIEVSEDAGRVYVVGEFTSIGGSSRTGGFASFDLATAEPTANVAQLDPNHSELRHQYSIDVLATDGLVYVAGSEHAMRVLDEETLELVAFYQSRNFGDFQALEQVGDIVYAGCHCSPGTTLAKADGVLYYDDPPAGEQNAEVEWEKENAWASAYDAATGERLDSFLPELTSRSAGIWAVQDGGNGCVFFGGGITGAGGTEQFGFTRLCGGDDNGPDEQRPDTPGQLRVSAVGNGSVTGSWLSASDNVAVTAYRVYDADTNQVVLETSRTSGTISGLAAGNHRFYIKAVDAAGNQSWRSGVTSVTISGGDDDERPATPPKAILVDVDADAVTLRVRATTDNVGVAGYRIYDADTGAVVADLEVDEGPATFLVTFDDVDDGDHRYFVKAYDGAGNQSWRSGFIEVAVS